MARREVLGARVASISVSDIPEGRTERDSRLSLGNGDDKGKQVNGSVPAGTLPFCSKPTLLEGERRTFVVDDLDVGGL